MIASRRLKRVAFAVFALGTVLIALGPVAAQVRELNPDWTAPTKEAARTNPLASRHETARGGAKLFRQRCVSCHGDDGNGTDRGPDLSASDVRAQSDGALFWKITSGNTRSGMPAFSFLPELQRWQLVMHLRTPGAAPPTYGQ